MQSVAPELLDKQKDILDSELKVAKLAAVEKLLWGSSGANHLGPRHSKGVAFAADLTLPLDK